MQESDNSSFLKNEVLVVYYQEKNYDVLALSVQGQKTLIIRIGNIK